ncbi:MAG TPA: hypothetical protein VD994_11315, partial [Prosthecobacter sp.]|nr:hypothetical protein [Prosthecobacter sp.]
MCQGHPAADITPLDAPPEVNSAAATAEGPPQQIRSPRRAEVRSGWERLGSAAMDSSWRTFSRAAARADSRRPKR